MGALPNGQLAMMRWGRNNLHTLIKHLNKSHAGPLAKCKANIRDVECENAELRFAWIDSTLEASGKALVDTARSQESLNKNKDKLKNLKKLRQVYRKFNAESLAAFESLNKAEGDLDSSVKAAVAVMPPRGYRARLPSDSTWSFDDTRMWLAWLKTDPPQGRNAVTHFKNVLTQMTALRAQSSRA
jgi:hypothetical protein